MSGVVWSDAERDAVAKVVRPFMHLPVVDRVAHVALRALGPFVAAREAQAASGCCACHGPAAAERDQLAETLRLRSEALDRVVAENERLRADLDAAREAYSIANEQMAGATERAAERDRALARVEALADEETHPLGPRAARAIRAALAGESGV